MNTKQKVTIWVAIGIIVGMLLVPPWKYIAKGKIGWEERGPYRLIFVPPEPTYSTSKRVRENSWRSTVRIDTARLMLPVCAVALIAAGLFVTFRSRKSD